MDQLHFFINKHTSCDAIWNELRKIEGQNTNLQITRIKNFENTVVTDSTEIAILLANTFVNNSKTLKIMKTLVPTFSK